MIKKYQETINLREKIESPLKERFSKKNIFKNVLIQRIIIFLIIILFCFTAYWMFLRDNNRGEDSYKSNWYAVKLINDEIYYGRIDNLTTDPVVVSDVYYNYNIDENNKQQVNETSNIRLVKRGNETHGPVGMMNIPRTQIIYMELLSKDSKVLKAILEHENEKI